MTTWQVLGLIVCFVVGFVSLTQYLKLSWGVWIKNLKRKPVTSNVPQYLVKAALWLLLVCVSAYAALLIYEWEFISWFWVFWVATLVVLLSAVGSLYWEIYWGRRVQQRHVERIAPEPDQRQETG